MKRMWVLVVGVCLLADCATALPDRGALAKKILTAEEMVGVGELLQNKGYRRTLLANEVLRLTGDAALKELSTDPGFDPFLADILGDEAWMMAYLTSGKPIANTAKGLRTLMELWKAEGQSPTFKSYCELTAAIANQWSVGPRAETFERMGTLKRLTARPVDRFRLFRDLDRRGRLHPLFRKLKAWELGYVVGQVWSDEALAWLNENVNLPLERYADACWAVEYKGTSDFGDTVQGPLYMRAWSDQMNEAQNAKLHGSVCGGLSTFGAISAAAHGIPAYTAGQPGHCAYAVRFARGDWHGGFGGPDGGVHLYIWHGNIHYVNLAERVFGDDAGLASATFRLARFQVLHEAGRMPQADAELAAAVKASPMHLDLRRVEIARLKERNLPAGEWRTYAAGLLASFGINSHPAIDLCSELETLMFADAGDEVKLQWYTKVHQAAALAEESWAWRIHEELLPQQAKALSSEEARATLLKHALTAHMSGKGDLFGKALEWGVTAFVKKSRAELFGKAFSEAVAATSGEAPDPKKQKAAYSKALLAAEEARSAVAFHALGQAAQAYVSAPPPLKLDLPPGRIVSGNGLIYASSSAWDDPINHAGVLQEVGGTIHTKDEQTPHIITQLPLDGCQPWRRAPREERWQSAADQACPAFKVRGRRHLVPCRRDGSHAPPMESQRPRRNRRPLAEV